MHGTLIDVIDLLDEVDDSDQFEPPCIFAEGGPDATSEARAIVCPRDENDSFACPLDPTLTEILMVSQAKECIEVWSQWRNGQRPTAQDKFAAVMFYARNDAWLPLE